MAEVIFGAKTRAQTSPVARVFISSLVCFGLMSSIVFPSIPLGGVDVYLVTLLSPIIFVVVLMCWVKSPIFHCSSLLPITLGLMVCLSSVFSWIYGFSSVNYRDILEAVKYTQFAPYLLVLPFISLAAMNVFHRSIVASSFLVGVIGFCQVLGFANSISYIYLGADSSHIDSVISGLRITLTGSDPNVGGVIASFFAIYFFSLYAEKRKLRFVFFATIFIFFCAMTQSRTALIALLLGLGFYYIFFFKGVFVLKWLALVFSGFFVIFLIFYLDLYYIYLGIQYALDGQNNSLNVRFENLYLAIQRFYESPIFGMGPAKSEFDTTIDSEYALIIQRYGLIGIIVFFFYVLYLFRLSLRNIKSHWGVCLFIFNFMSILVMMTNNVFSGYQLMSLVIFLNMACVINEKMEKPLN
ncbi:O-antigen ligase family protein [Marinobacter salsuginis]|uniref:O-antigen ligase family protein n=1 Tax=Marinobacter salsuginis TaxID=418719 RepID=UPI0012990FF5|nr:O-antigen ligase family protein [Marinobacter salsuginis]